MYEIDWFSPFSYLCKYHYRLTSKIQMSLMPTHLGGEHLQMRCALRLIKDHPRLKNHLLYIESNMKILLRIFPVSFPKGFCNHYSIIILYVRKRHSFSDGFQSKNCRTIGILFRKSNILFSGFFHHVPKYFSLIYMRRWFFNKIAPTMQISICVDEPYTRNM